jgi:hypothetical protein
MIIAEQSCILSVCTLSDQRSPLRNAVIAYSATFRGNGFCAYSFVTDA